MITPQAHAPSASLKPLDLYVEQQIFALPGTDHFPVVLHLLEFHVLIGFDKLLAESLFQGLCVVQLVERLIEADWERVSVTIG